MPKVLSQADLDTYKEQGIHFSVSLFSAEEADVLFKKFEALEASQGGRLSQRVNTKCYLTVPWIQDLVRDPRILDVVEDILGPDLLCWSASFFAKGAKDSSFVSWHQDATYWGLDATDVLTVWVALTPSRPENGCMRVVPGSHKSQVAHVDTFDEKNLLSRGQEIAVKVNPDEALDVVLEPGQASIHNVLIVHGSEPNGADYRRVGFAIRYIPTRVRQTSGVRDSATLVRGTDTYNHFDQELAPHSEFHPDAVAHHAAIVDRKVSILYAGAADKGRHETVK